ncbi:hypothetical protein [Pseudomonas fluorescens]|uniref:hypothetical protein n=1 Tax=Pseudomonas fluorescens TaxID=294 RepID=UPI00124234BC|nr:hypothetical protein [Pseudomonas fluorescens]
MADLVPALRRRDVCAIPLLRISASLHLASLTRQNNEIERDATADNEINKYTHTLISPHPTYLYSTPQRQFNIKKIAH